MALIRRWVVIAVVVVLAIGAAAFAAGTTMTAVRVSHSGSVTAQASLVPHATPFAVTKTCASGYTHAVIGGVQKCLHAGQYCTHRYDRQYRRYGYRCIRYDASAHRYRLTRS